jgi:hypothetical protein
VLHAGSLPLHPSNFVHPPHSHAPREPQVIIVEQTGAYFGRSPVQCVCPNCRANVITEVRGGGGGSEDAAAAPTTRRGLERHARRADGRVAQQLARCLLNASIVSHSCVCFALA